MGIIFAILFIWFAIWFTEKFSRFCGTILTGATGYACIWWGLNFIGSENLSVQLYGWFFMALTGWMVLIVISTIIEIIEDIQIDLEYKRDHPDG